MPGPNIGIPGGEYAGGGRGVEIEMIEICRGGSIFGEATGSFSASDTCTGTTGTGMDPGSGSVSGSVTVALSWGTGGSGVGTGSGSNSTTGEANLTGVGG